MQKYHSERLLASFSEQLNSPYLRLFTFLAVKTLLVLLLAYELGICLTPDEAQYWTWSQHLDWGYYSKPPAIAWQIWLGTTFLGDTELGVRLVSALFGIGLGLAVYRLAKICQPRLDVAFWSGLWMGVIPAGWLGSLLAITDVGLVLFWTIGCQEVAEALQEKRPIHSLRLGGSFLIAGLFKWVAFLFWPLFLGFLFVRWKETLFLRGRGLIWAGFIASLAIVPSLIWNENHGWATFLHVQSTLQGGHSGGAGNFWEFLGAQLLLFTPLLFWFIGLALNQFWTRLQQESLAYTFLFWMGSVSLMVAIALAMQQKMQGNWAIFAYPPLVVVAVREIFIRLRRPLVWHIWGSVMTCGVVMGVFILPILLQFSEKAQPLKQALGWSEMGKILVDLGYRSQEHFLLADTYQTSSLLSFYLPGKKRAYFLNLQNIRNNQFSYWPGLVEEQLGKSGYFVRIGHWKKDPDLPSKYQALLEPYFQRVSWLGAYPLWPYGEESRRVFVFLCEEAMPVSPPMTSLF